MIRIISRRKEVKYGIIPKPVAILALLSFISVVTSQNNVDQNEDARVPDPFRHEMRSRKTPQWIPTKHESSIYVDLVFLVDGSGSLTQENFDTVMDWILEVSFGFDMSTGIFQIGVVQYSHWYRTRDPQNQDLMRTEIALGECNNTDCLERKLKAIKLMGYTTYTGFAINKTVNEDFRRSTHYGYSTKILVLVTDGKSQDEVLQSANYARFYNVTIFCVGIDKYDLRELQLIATGHFFNNLRVYQLPDFYLLPTITSSLQSEIKSSYILPVCPPLQTRFRGTMACTNVNRIGSTCFTYCDSTRNFTLFGGGKRTCQITPIGIAWVGTSGTCGVCDENFDLLVILDSSPNTSRREFNSTKEFLKDLIEALSIGPDKVQVSCMTTGQGIRDDFEYNHFRTKRSLIKAVDSIRLQEEPGFPGNLFRYAVDNKFSLPKGRRYNYPHVTLLITNRALEEDEMGDSTKRLKRISRVISIGLKDAKQHQIEMISSNKDPATLPAVAPYAELSKVDKQWRTLKRFCDAVASLRTTFCGKVSEPDHGCSYCDENVANLNMNTTNNVPVGTKRSLVCDVGFRTPQGTAEATCDYNGQWLKKNWRCAEKDCESDSESDGVVVTCNKGNKIGSVCISRCRPGYHRLASSNEELCEASVDNELYRCIRTCQKINGGDPEWDSNGVTCESAGECADNVCVYGTCEDKGDKFFCDCQPGYTGVFCEVDIDECKPDPCLNGACENRINGFKCHCDAGFEGRHCDRNINECAWAPCGPGGKCIDGVNGFICECLDGYDGPLCENNIDDCASAPCKNSAVCHDEVASFACDCVDGFDGTVCENNIDDCIHQPCLNGGICIDKIKGYTCLCPDGYTGSVCFKDINECNSDPCQNGAWCQNSIGSYSCTCKEGYRGNHCEIEINECKSNPCINHISCTNLIGDYKCNCKVGFTGRNCEKDIDDCLFQTCRNGGTCVDGQGDFSCKCPTGYRGKRCEEVKKACEPNPCGRNGICEEGKSLSYRCKCNPGFEGAECQVNKNDCNIHTCLNNATCIDKVDDFECDCQVGYTGKRCQLDIDECDQPNFDCSKHGRCKNTFGGYLCDCETGYTGENCEIDIDDCQGNSCQNGALCHDELNGYSCICPEGYSGIHCENRCGPATCKNSGTCIELPDSFHCNCTPGYIGSHCEVYKNPCDMHPCKNGGKCHIHELTGYRCDCLPEYKGVDCTDDVNECEMEKPVCKNGAICNNKYGGFNCTCKEGYLGILCDEKKCELQKPSSETNGMACSNGGMPGSVCSLHCPKNWKIQLRGGRIKMMSDLSLTCDKNGSWYNSTYSMWASPEKISCENILCRALEDTSQVLAETNGVQYSVPFIRADLNPEQVNNRVHTINCTNGTNVGSACELHCHEAFVLIGQVKRTCDENGNWDGARWRCKQERCLKPFQAGKSHLLNCTDGFNEDSRCTLTCMLNFGLIGIKEKRCSSKLEWEPHLPWGCREVRCTQSLPNIINGSFTCSNEERIGSICKIHCRPGFFLHGEGLFICTSMGLKASWKGTAGICKKSECDFMVDLKSGESRSSKPHFVSMRKPNRRGSAKQQNECNMKTILTINITEQEFVTAHLWYGPKVLDYHTVITNNQSTNGYNTPSPGEFLLTGVAAGLFTSGFGYQDDDKLQPLPATVEENSNVTITLEYNSWSWQWRGGLWKGEIMAKNSGNGVNQAWYEVFFGVNRIPNPHWYYNVFVNGTGLCYVCLNKNSYI